MSPRSGSGTARLPKQLLWIAGLLAFSLLLAGCTQKADWASTQRQAGTPAGDLYGTHTVGQTFVPSHDGLNGVELLLVDYGPESNRSAAALEFTLCRDLACQDVVTHTTLQAENIAHNQPYLLRCPPQPDSAGRTYTLEVSAPQAMIPAEATVWAHSADYYPDGSLLRDGLPAAGDLNFVTTYDLSAGQLARELLEQVPVGLGALPALLLLLLAPGYLLARLLPRSRSDEALDLLGYSLGLSVAVVPLLLLLLSLLGPVLSGLAVRLGGSAIGLVALVLLILDLRRGRWRGLSRIPAPVWVAFGGIVAVGLVLRAEHALDLAGPPWVDAVHHTLLARLIVERRAIPGDYLPYVEVAPATYHFGFQSLVAVLHHLTGRSLPDCLLLLGQVLSGLTALPLYTLGRRWSRSRWGGLAAAAVPAALSLMPSYYISWSRYTELAGLLLLPLAVMLLERWLLMPRWHWGLAGGTAVVLAGMLVTHLRVAAFLAVLAALLVLAATLRWCYPGAWIPLRTRVLAATLRRRYRLAWIPWVRALAVALAAAVVIGPWLIPSILHLWLPAAQTWPEAQEPLSLYYVLFGLGRYVAPVIAVGAAMGVLWRRRETLLLALWVGILFLMANPGLVGLHVGAVVDNTAVEIALYIPLSIAAALAAGGAAHVIRRANRSTLVAGWRARLLRLARRLRPAGRGWRWAAAVLLVALCAWGAYQLRDIVNPRTIILTPADLHAMAWIQENTAPDDIFLINSYEWMAHVYAGTDGGYWITPLTGRPTWPPPALYGLGTGEYMTLINDVSQKAMTITDGATLHSLLREHGIDYVFLGRYGGSLQPEMLLAYPGFRLVYHQEGVWVFAVQPSSGRPL